MARFAYLIVRFKNIFSKKKVATYLEQNKPAVKTFKFFNPLLELIKTLTLPQKFLVKMSDHFLKNKSSLTSCKMSALKLLVKTIFHKNIKFTDIPLSEAS